MKLIDHADEILAISRKSKVSPSAAVDLFIVNLNVMKEFHKGSGTFNYRSMGQEWGRLPYSEKNAQKSAAKRNMSQPSESEKVNTRRQARRVED